MKKFGFLFLCFLSILSDPILTIKISKSYEVNKYNVEDPFEHFGTGLIISKDGYILVSNDFIAEGSKIFVKQSGKYIQAVLIARDIISGFALIKIKATNLETAQFAKGAISKGKYKIKGCFNGVSDCEGSVEIIKTNVAADNYTVVKSCNGNFCKNLSINVDIAAFAINKGISGSCLFDEKNQVVGMTISAFDVLDNSGMIYLVSAEKLKKIANDLLAFGKVKRGWLSCEVKSIENNLKAMNKEMEGIFITKILENSQMAKNGIKQGDIILKINGFSIQNEKMFKKIVFDSEIGSEIKLEILSKSKNGFVKKIVSLKIEEYEEKSETKSLFFDLEFRELDKESVEYKTINKINADFKNCLKIMKIQTDSSYDLDGIEENDILVCVGNDYNIKSIQDFDAAILKALKNRQKYIILLLVRNEKVVSYALSLEKLIKMEG